MKYAASSDIGKRLHNEDSYLVPDGDALPCLFAVADGMGGHAAGAVASGLIVDGLSELEISPDRSVEQLSAAIERVNLAVYRAAEQDATLHGMGSTLVCALVDGRRYTAANVGDSRLYHLHDGVLSRVTIDHSLVEQFVLRGVITAEEARVHPQRNIITRAVGLCPSVYADIFEREWSAGDLLLLCSDGLHGTLSDDEIAEALRVDRPPEETCAALVQAALDHGATDNITAVLVRCEKEDVL